MILKKLLNLKTLSFLTAFACSSNLSCHADSFDFELYKNLAKNKSKSNLLISPFSVSSALTLTSQGADGTTYDAMIKVLNLEGTKTEIKKNFKETTESLKEVGDETTLALANNLFANEEIPLSENFIQEAKQNFDADCMNLDFGKDSANSVNKINAWVAEKTKDKITSVVDKIDRDTALFIVNAIYFKSNWQDKFDEKLTASKSFHTGDEQMVKVKTMLAERKNFQYFQTDDFQALCLPYKDNRFRLLIFLPSENSSLESFASSLTDQNWKDWLSKFKESPGKITLPKFNIEDNMKLKEPLKTLGMSEAFDNKKADFSNFMGATTKPPKIFISDVLHKTLMDVNEEGTEAATSTVVVMDRKMAQQTNPYFEMKINRPFVFALHDQKTDKVLFLGHINDPSTESAPSTTKNAPSGSESKDSSTTPLNPSGESTK